MSYTGLDIILRRGHENWGEGCIYWVSSMVFDKANRGHRLFSDTLFIAGCGRFLEGTAEQMHRSLSYLGSLPEDTVVYNGHEYTSASVAFGVYVSWC